MGRIWTKLLIALRGGGSGAADAMVAHQALRILDHEIHEAEEHVGLGRSSLANLMAKNILAAREAEQTRMQLVELTGQARKALATGCEDLALEAASKIGRLELVLVEDTRIAREYARSVDNLRLALEANEEKLRLLKQQVEQVRATDLMQQVHASLSQARSESTLRLQAVADALDAIRQHQMEIDARLQAEAEVCMRDEVLERRLRNPAVLADYSGAFSVLERIRAGGRRKHS